MAYLLKTTIEVRNYLKIDIAEKEASWLPYVPDATEKYIRPWLGDDMLETLTEYYNDESPTPDEALDALLPYVQRALARFTFLLAAPHLDVNVQEGGFTVRSNQNSAPASRERVNAFMASLAEQGWDAIEQMLKFLEDNASDYDDWTGSDAYSLSLRNFINSAAEFNKYVDIKLSRLAFAQFRNIMDDIEILRIEAAISKEQSDAIKAEIVSGDISEETQAILPYLKRAVANFTMANINIPVDTSQYQYSFHFTILADKRAEYAKNGELFLGKALEIMDETPTDYPEYEASDQYDAERTNYAKFENAAANNIFVFGQQSGT